MVKIVNTSFKLYSWAWTIDYRHIYKSAYNFFLHKWKRSGVKCVLKLHNITLYGIVVIVILLRSLVLVHDKVRKWQRTVDYRRTPSSKIFSMGSPHFYSVLWERRWRVVDNVFDFQICPIIRNLGNIVLIIYL